MRQRTGARADSRPSGPVGVPASGGRRAVGVVSRADVFAATSAISGDRSIDRGLDNYADQVARADDRRGIERATICGVSFGGLIAVRFAARHAVALQRADPGVDAEAGLAAAAAPRDLPARAVDLRAAVPRRNAVAPARRRSCAAIPDAAARRRFCAAAAAHRVGAPSRCRAMAGARAHDRDRRRRRPTARRITAPTLVVTGERASITSCRSTARRSTCELIPERARVVLERTGHLGIDHAARGVRGDRPRLRRTAQPTHAAA